MRPMDEATLARLQCPITKTPLSLVDSDMIAQINQAIADHALKTSDDEVVNEPIEGGLVNQEQTWLYPIRNGIPTLLTDEAIDLLSLPSSNDDGNG